MTSRPDVLPKYPIHGSPIPMTTATHRDAIQSVKSIFLRIRTSCLVCPVFEKNRRGRCTLQVPVWIPSYGIVVVSVTGRNVTFAESE